MRINIRLQAKSLRKMLWVMFALTMVTFTLSCKTSKENQASADQHKKLSQEEQIQLTALFIDGIREKSLENDDKAIGLFSQCIKRNPQYAPAMYEIAQLFDYNKRYSEAADMANNAIHFEPGNEWYQKLLADIYVNMKNYTAAAKILKQLSDKHPENSEMASDLVNICILAAKYNDAISALDNIENIYGVAEETSLEKEKLYLGMGKMNKAIDEIEKLVKAFPSEPKYLGLLAELYVSTGNNFKALEVYQKILEIDPTDPFVHLSLSDYYRSQNNDEKSFEELKLAFGNTDLDIDKKVGILLQYFKLSETQPEAKKEAYELIEIIVRVHPDDAKAWSIYGDFLYRDKRLSDARTAFRKVNAIDSSKYVVWEQLLAIESEMGDYKAMLDESSRTLALFPEQAEPYLYNGFANMKANKIEDAIKSFKTGLDFAADNALIIKFHTNLGDAYYKNKKYDDSFESFEKVLKIDSKNIYVLNNYSYYLALQNQNLSRAEELAKKLNELEKDKPSYEDTYAWVLFKQEKYMEAATWLEKSLSHGGETNAAILEHYGDVLYKLNDTVKAVEYWEKAKVAGGNSEILLKKINDKKWYE
jgi:tetratricopeptide (TPR) repeat protein